MNIIAIAGDTGTGKTYSSRNLKNVVIFGTKSSPNLGRGWKKHFIHTNPEEIISTKGEILSANKDKSVYIELTPDSLKQVTDTVNKINKRPELSHYKTIIVEDIVHYLQEASYNKAFTSKNGFAKWADLASTFYELLISELISIPYRKDLNVVVHFHTIYNESEGKYELALPGNMLKNLKPFSRLNYVFLTEVLPYDPNVKPEDRYLFVTNDNGKGLAKSPAGALELMEPNDLELIFKKIEQYELGE